MAACRIRSQSFFSRASLLRPTTFFIRHSSNKAQLVEIDLESSSSTQADSPEEVLTMGFKKLEDAIQNIVIRRAAPAWLPFRPGSSYWVPPRSPLHSGQFPGVMFEAFGKLGSPRNGSRMGPIDVTSEDELMSCTSKKGWPSSAFFIEGTSPMPIPVVEVEVKVEHDEDDKSGSESEKDD